MKNVTYINAGAGSGKTYTLTKILADKLTDKSNPVLPSQVILTTFTELAASEFREKARQQILAAGNLSAAAQMDSAAIGTVHSIALNFIKKFWYLLDYGADIQTISERDEDFYMSQSLSRIVSERGDDGKLRKQVDLDTFRDFRDYFDIVDGFSKPDYLFWQRHLKAIVEKMEYYDVDDVDESIEKSIDTVSHIYSGVAITKDIEQRLLDYVKNYYNYIANNASKTASEHRELIKPFLNNCNNVYELTSLMPALSEPVGGAKNIEKLCPGYTQFMDNLNNLFVSSSNKQIMKTYIEAIFNLAKEWRDDNIEYKKRNHIISYNDMERLFLYLLTDTSAVEAQDYIKNNIRLVMVDEFQDSNPIQLKIFNRLSDLIAPAGGHSYWVGDPKQAIYGFRGADTALINSVASHFTFFPDDQIHSCPGPDNLRSQRLVESWRSRPQLVNLVNDVFIDKFKGEINPLCITLTPHFKDNLSLNALEHWSGKKSGQGNQKNIKANDLAWKVKELLASECLVHSGKLDETPTEIRPKDVAILCRKNSTAKDVVKSLRGYNVPVSEPEDDIMQRIEVQLVTTLLQLIQNPGDKHAIADLMRLLWGQTPKDILRDRIDYVWAKDDAGNYLHFEKDGKFTDDEWKENDARVKELVAQTEKFKRLSIPEMVRGIIYECNLPALVAKWGDLHIRQQNLSTLQHLADDYDQMCLQMGLGSSISGFIYYLNIIEPDKESDNQSNTVKVLTYHGSKGLEWPVVILNELNVDTLEDGTLIRKSFMRVREVELSLEDEATETDLFAKRYYLHFFPDIVNGLTGKPSKSMIDTIKEMELYTKLRERAKGEETRILYVGMTRAKDCLISVGIEDNENKTSKKKTEENVNKDNFKWLTNIGLTGCDNNNVWGLESYKREKQDIQSPDGTAVPTEEQTYTIVKKPKSHTAYRDRYLSPSKIGTFAGYSSHNRWKESGVEINTSGWGNDYATIGSCIHDIFAAYKKGDYKHNREIATNIIGGYGVPGKLAGHIDAIINSADWLYGQLQAKYPQREGDRIERELPFIYTLASGQTLRGEMDLIWHYTDDGGKHAVLVDYKTYQGVDLDEHTKTHYAQLSAYAKALKDAGVDVTHALVYYPVRGEIFELS
jgi:ATP-dependent helicase/nuclease subunit A